jgi:hypothetical protein
MCPSLGHQGQTLATSGCPGPSLANYAVVPVFIAVVGKAVNCN